MPTVVGAALALFAKATGHIPANVTVAIVPAITTAYYSAVKYLEKKHPAWSWLLGALPAK